MARVLIVYHTLSGNTEKMAQASAEGAKSVQGTEVVIKKAFEATLEDLLVPIHRKFTRFSIGLKSLF
jgi:NAD(P)H dehydrogenase (quinone)